MTRRLARFGFRTHDLLAVLMVVAWSAAILPRLV